MFSHLADAPACLKKELNQVLTLQTEIESLDTSIARTKQAVKASENSKHRQREAIELLTQLQNTHSILKEQADHLYASLNLSQEFPELKGVSLPFLQTLLLARDLKINIRKRAVGSFFEWE